MSGGLWGKGVEIVQCMAGVQGSPEDWCWCSQVSSISSLELVGEPDYCWSVWKGGDNVQCTLHTLVWGSPSSIMWPYKNIGQSDEIYWILDQLIFLPEILRLIQTYRNWDWSPGPIKAIFKLSTSDQLSQKCTSSFFSSFRSHFLYFSNISPGKQNRSWHLDATSPHHQDPHRDAPPPPPPPHPPTSVFLSSSSKAMLSSFRPRSENPPPTKSCHLSPLPSSSSVGIPTSLLAPSGLIPSRRRRRWNCTWIRDKTESPSQTNPGLVFIQIPHNAHCSPMIGIKLLATARRRLWLCKPLVRDQLSVFKAVVSGGGGAEREAEGKRKSFSIIGVERPAAPHLYRCPTPLTAVAAVTGFGDMCLLPWRPTVQRNCAANCSAATCACPALAPNCAAKAVMQAGKLGHHFERVITLIWQTKMHEQILNQVYFDIIRLHSIQDRFHISMMQSYSVIFFALLCNMCLQGAVDINSCEGYSDQHEDQGDGQTR